MIVIVVYDSDSKFLIVEVILKAKTPNFERSFEKSENSSTRYGVWGATPSKKKKNPLKKQKPTISGGLLTVFTVFLMQI